MAEWEWDQPFSDEDLRAIDAIEAAFLSRPASVPSKRPLTPPKSRSPRRVRRHLPSSVLDPPKRFSLSPCQRNVRVRYPAMKFGGRVVYGSTEAEVENASRELLQCLEVRKSKEGRVAVGFDIEWKPTFKAGVLPGKAAVMQICADAANCYVLHIIHSGITPSLKRLLDDSLLVKVGVGIGNDCVKVFKDYNVSVKAVEDLSYLANFKFGGQAKSWSLQSLTETLVCRELDKPNKIRLGNWEVDVLSNDQLQYAAIDAFTSWHLYQALKSLPDAATASGNVSEEKGSTTS